MSYEKNHKETKITPVCIASDVDITKMHWFWHHSLFIPSRQMNGHVRYPRAGFFICNNDLRKCSSDVEMKNKIPLLIQIYCIFVATIYGNPEHVSGTLVRM